MTAIKRLIIALGAFIATVLTASAQEPMDAAGIGPAEAVNHSPEEREGRLLAAEIEAVYAAYLPLAETLYEIDASMGLEGDVLRAMALAPPYPADLSSHLMALRETRADRLTEAGALHDPVSLIERAPKSANFFNRFIRLSRDDGLNAVLFERMTPLAGTSALHPQVYAGLETLLQERRISSEESASEVSTAAPEILQAFTANYERFIEPVRTLGRARGRDIFIRTLFVPHLSGLDGPTRDALIAKISPVIQKIDRENVEIALAILDDHGFETLHRGAPTATELIAALIHHGGTLEEKRHLLDAIEPLALAGQFDGQRYALMFDRQAESEGRPQRYGTQDMCVDGKHEIYTLESPERVDEFRAAMGLGSLEDYRTELIGIYGEDC